MAQIRLLRGAMMTVMRSFFISAVVQYAAYVVATVNFRAIADEQYVWAWGTSVVFAALSYTIVRHVIKDETWATVLGMMVGGGLGDLSGIWITRHWA